jgi:hypothetical protein
MTKTIENQCGSAKVTTWHRTDDGIAAVHALFEKRDALSEEILKKIMSLPQLSIDKPEAQMLIKIYKENEQRKNMCIKRTIRLPQIHRVKNLETEIGVLDNLRLLQLLGYGEDTPDKTIVGYHIMIKLTALGETVGFHLSEKVLPSSALLRLEN